MQTLLITYDTPINTSVQVGDLAFYVPTTPVGSTNNTFSSSIYGNILFLGEIINIITEDEAFEGNKLVVLYDESIVTGPVVSDFLMFAKNRKANTASLKGYFAEIDFVNDSTSAIELFSVGLQTTESSK